MRPTRLVPCLLLAASCLFGQYRRGVNVSGAEFGNTNLPGVYNHDYTFNSEATFQYFGQKNLGLIRLPIQWERIQPVPSGPLDATYLGRLKGDIAWARAHGCQVIIDPHNFGRYSIIQGGSLKTYVIDNKASDGTVPVSSADLANLWVRLSNEFKFDGTVYAYDLMNEPHDMGQASWKTISQTVLSAIRANQDDKLVLIPGDSWSSGNRWVTTHGPTGWIQDPANNFVYEAHQYFDHDESGTYASTYDAELASNPNLATVGSTRIAHFVSWVQNNNVRGLVDEFGIPSNDPRWAAVLDDFLNTLDAAGMDGAYWAAGEWWGSYLLSVQPSANFTQDRPQMTTLQAHLGRGSLTALSSGSASVARAIPGSLVTVYGTGFTSQTAQASNPPGTAWPVSLADITVQVTDSTGSALMAGLLFVNGTQVNLQMPPMLAPGRATIAVLRSGTKVASGGITVAATAPAIITANSVGYGTPAAWIDHRHADGTDTFELAFQYDSVQQVYSPTSIDFGPSTDRVFLSLYGTGIHATSATMQINGASVPVQYAGPQSQYAGLDQVNVELPRTLAAAGQVTLNLWCDGVAANAVTIAFK